MDSMQIIVALVLGLLLIGFGFFFIYKYVWGAGETVGDWTPDDIERAKEGCELKCAQAKTTARSCEDWAKKYCGARYLEKTCGEVDGNDIAKCAPPSKFQDGTMGVDCECA